jgi:hypothetical protein
LRSCKLQTSSNKHQCCCTTETPRQLQDATM